MEYLYDCQNPSIVPEPLLPCGLLSEHADPFLTCKFWTCQPFFLDLQVFQQTVEQSCVPLRCCLKHSLSCEGFTTNVWGINVILAEMQQKHTIQTFQAVVVSVASEFPGSCLPVLCVVNGGGFSIVLTSTWNQKLKHLCLFSSPPIASTGFKLEFTDVDKL